MCSYNWPFTGRGGGLPYELGRKWTKICQEIRVISGSWCCMKRRDVFKGLTSFKLALIIRLRHALVSFCTLTQTPLWNTFNSFICLNTTFFLPYSGETIHDYNRTRKPAQASFSGVPSSLCPSFPVHTHTHTHPRSLSLSHMILSAPSYHVIIAAA